MRSPTYYLYFTHEERTQIIESLNTFRNKLIQQGKYTDAVDDVIVKICNAKRKKIKII